MTNLSYTPNLEKFLSWDKELLKHLEFKCSFNYLELKKKGLLDVFADNVNKIWAAGASANIEITPSDELIPFIDEGRICPPQAFSSFSSRLWISLWSVLSTRLKVSGMSP